MKTLILPCCAWLRLELVLVLSQEAEIAKNLSLSECELVQCAIKDIKKMSSTIVCGNTYMVDFHIDRLMAMKEAIDQWLIWYGEYSDTFWLDFGIVYADMTKVSLLISRAALSHDSVN